MLAKPLKIAGATALPTNSPNPEWGRDGGTAWTKRTQGSDQAAGNLAKSLRLIQPRKSKPWKPIR
jgi:hypothetical protein